MANTFFFESKMGVSHPASTVKDGVIFTTPDQNETQTTNIQALVAEFTGTSSNNVTVGASGLVTVNSTNAVDPITGVNLDWDNYKGLKIVVDRAAAATAPTGSVAISTTGFMGMAISNCAVGEDFVLAVKHTTAPTASNTEALVVNLTGTTGYKVSVLCVGSYD